jgi:hypothetical protein
VREGSLPRPYIFDCDRTSLCVGFSQVYFPGRPYVGENAGAYQSGAP